MVDLERRQLMKRITIKRVVAKQRSRLPAQWFLIVKWGCRKMVGSGFDISWLLSFYQRKRELCAFGKLVASRLYI